MTDHDPAPTPDAATEPDTGTDWRATAHQLSAELEFTQAQLEHAQAIIGATTGVLVGLDDDTVRLYRDGRGFFRDRFGACHVTDADERPVAVYAEHRWRFAEFTAVAARSEDG